MEAFSKIGKEIVHYLTIKLILYDIIKYFQQKENQMMIAGTREQKPWRGECLENIQENKR